MASRRTAATTATTVVVAVAAATGIWLGTTNSSSPKVTAKAPSIGAIQLKTGWAVIQFNYTAIPNASAYRDWVDGHPGSVHPWTGALMALSCGVRHRYNVQGVNGAGLGPLATPVYITPACP